MKLLSHFLCLCLVLALAWANDHGGSHTSGEGAGTHSGHGGNAHHEMNTDRCGGIEMDAVAVNHDGVPYFFKSNHLFKGFAGRAERSSDTLAGLEGLQSRGHVDAAFHMHNSENVTDDRMVVLIGPNVLSYRNDTLEDGYPKDISEAFPGVPEHLDAAVECPNPECAGDSVFFFKGNQIHQYDVTTRTLEQKDFSAMPNCTSALRYMGHYYCFHGHKFSKFNPKTGEVEANYPKEARGYFMRCANFGDDNDHVEREKCSRVHLDAITSDNDGNLYAFRGHHFLSKNAATGEQKAASIESTFREVHSDVEAAFSHDNKLYLAKGDNLYAYNVGETHTLVDGYPKSVTTELGIEAPFDAAFHCEGNNLYIVKDQQMFSVDLSAAQRTAINPITTPLSRVDTIMCDREGLKVIAGNHYYSYESPMAFSTAKSIPVQHKVSMELFGCDH